MRPAGGKNAPCRRQKTKLDDRLRQVADYAADGNIIADIGADHAKLAIYLTERDKIVRAVAADLNAGPCAAAREQIAAAGLGDKISVRQGDGLSVLEPGEVDTVCIAGMGGGLIAKILSDVPSVTQKLARLVLQPMNDAFLLRAWLYRNGWHIEDENLAEVVGHIYAVILAERGAEAEPNFWRLYVGPKICDRRPTLLKKYIEGKLVKIRRALQGMERSAAAKKEAKFAELKALERSLEEMIN